jgi:DNA-binding response OmpR family regulator
MKVLIVEDDTQLNIAICEFFELKSFHYVTAKDGLQALKYIDTQAFDLFVIDINIPELSGLDVLKYIRTVDTHAPIIMITASLEIENFSTAFKNGCSEYIKKPFHLKELDIRVNKLLAIQKSKRIMFGNTLYYDMHNEEFSYKEKSIPLRYKEKRFSTLMMQNINNYVSLDTIYDYVWEGETKDNYPLRQLIAGLRKKLPVDIIQTKVKVGYIINACLI